MATRVGTMFLAITAALLPLPGGAAQNQTPDCCRNVTLLEKQLAVQTRLLHDWGGLTRYGSENTEVRPAAGEDRVVFFGDEITEMWGRGSEPFFPGRPYFNRGIGGQTTPQMLVRFRQDVIALKPKVVVILAGANDIAGLSGPATEGVMAENFMSMTELAQAHGMRVVLASATPVCDCFAKQTARRSPGRIMGINGWLKNYAARSGSVYLDYYSALADGRDLRKDMTVDGLLPNDAGYRRMAPLAEQAIAQALGKNRRPQE